MNNSAPRQPQQRVLSILADDGSLVVTPSNSDAWCAICRWRTWPEACMALTGPPASGKSTMTSAWSTHANARHVNGRTLADMSIASIHALTDRALAVDDAHTAGETLLAILNLFRNSPLLLTAPMPPSAWPMLTCDLQSRLDAIPVTCIAPPCDTTMHTLLIAACRKHLIRLPWATGRYLVRHMPHSYSAISTTAEAMALSGTPANMTTARSILNHIRNEHAYV